MMLFWFILLGRILTANMLAFEDGLMIRSANFVWVRLRLPPIFSKTVCLPCRC